MRDSSAVYQGADRMRKTVQVFRGASLFNALTRWKLQVSTRSSEHELGGTVLSSVCNKLESSVDVFLYSGM